MTLEAIEAAPISLGAFLQSTRREQGLDIDTIANDTKISERNLRAIEAGDFPLLPAEVFARGFYRLYAEVLSLDPEEILSRYDQERGTQPRTPSILSPPAIKSSKDVGTMAERPSMLPSSTIGLALIILLLFGGFLCWYFSWNPASFFSQKLRSLQHTPEEIEQVQTDHQVRGSSARFASTFNPCSPCTSARIEYVFLTAQARA